MDLLSLFTLLVKYNLPFTNKKSCILEIQNWFMNSGSVWQKFAQVLSQYEEVVGKDLAFALSKMCFDCPAHDDKYSARIIKDAFGDKYNTKNMKMVGSGTISQVYKVVENDTNRIVAIKVMHPNVKREIRDAYEAYNNIKSSSLFPRRFTTILSLFFNGLKEQLLMNREFKNGKLFKKTMQPTNNENYLFVIPEMIEYSKKCLVMEYEKSLILAKINVANLSETEQQTLHKACNSIKLLGLTMTVNGFLHGDLHFGNIGIQNFGSNMKIVIYDFGQCFDISNMNKRKQIVKSFLYKNSGDFISYTIPKYQNELIPKMTNNFEDDIRIIGNYILLNEIQVDKNVLNTIISWGKMKSNVEMLCLLINKYNCEDTTDYLLENGIQKYIDKYLPYDDFNCFRNFTM